MNIDVRRRLFVVAAVLGGLAVFAAAFFVALGVRSVVADPGGSPPNPGHSWSEIGDLPGTMWHSNNDGAGSGLDADLLDGLDSTAFSTGPHTTSLPWNSITSKPAGFADDVDDDILGGLSCANGQIAKWDTSAWGCGQDVDTDTQLSEGQVETFVTNEALDLHSATTLGGASICTGPHTTSLPWTAITSKPAGFADDVDDDTLGGLSCANGQIAKWDTSAWQCAADDTGAGGAYWTQSGGDLYPNSTAWWVGVGTTDAQVPLDVAGASQAQKGVLRITDTLGADPFMSFYDSASTFKAYVGYVEGLAQLGSADGSNVAITHPTLGGNVGIGTLSPSHKLTIESSNDDTLRLIGPDDFGHGARLNFGDGDYAYIGEDADDELRIHSRVQTAITGGDVGIGTDSPSADLHVAGDLLVEGAYRGNIGPNNGAPFPRPAYDSGWVNINLQENKILTHGLGGNTDNYVVDLQFKSDTPGAGINQIYYGGSMEHNWAANWSSLTNTTIEVYRMSLDAVAHQIRVRIWVYN
jgi:hypothetical protein